MKIGYSFWGFLGDVKMDVHGNYLSTPDGNASYSWAIISEMQKRGHDVHAMQTDRDRPAWLKLGPNLFKSFSNRTRKRAYKKLIKSGDDFPDLDVLLVEWRWQIPGRNFAIPKDHPDYQPDFDRQYQLLKHYSQNKTKIVLWDLDHKIGAIDEMFWKPAKIIETSVKPLKLTMDRQRVEPPIFVDQILQHKMKPLYDIDPIMTYIGSRYERDDVIDEWIKPISDLHPTRVKFCGKWEGDSKTRWPKVDFRGRVSMSDFLNVYSITAACPLLAKRSYLETGFITPRIWEALMFGAIPIGLRTHNGIDQYLPGDLIARDAHHLGEIAIGLSRKPVAEREEIRQEIVEKIKFMDVANFVDIVLK